MTIIIWTTEYLLLLSRRVLCIQWHSIVLRVGVNKLVKCVCGVGFALSLAITAGHVTEKFVWLKGCSYMKNLRTGEAEREAIWDKVSRAVRVARCPNFTVVLGYT